METLFLPHVVTRKVSSKVEGPISQERIVPPPPALTAASLIQVTIHRSRSVGAGATATGWTLGAGVPPTPLIALEQHGGAGACSPVTSVGTAQGTQTASDVSDGESATVVADTRRQQRLQR